MHCSTIPTNLGSDALRDRGGTTALAKGCSAILAMVALMNRSGQQSSNLLLTLARSYSRDLKHWLGVLTTRYAAGAGLLAAGVVFLIIAAGIATSAAFHALEVHYGTYVAYGIVGGMFLLLGVSGLAAGRVMLSRPTTPLPTPKRQFQVLKQSITAPAVAALVAQGGQRAARNRSRVAGARDRRRGSTAGVDCSQQAPARAQFQAGVNVICVVPVGRTTLHSLRQRPWPQSRFFVN